MLTDVEAWVGPLDDPHRYRLEDGLDPVASGGEGFVYRGRRAGDGACVAVKQLVNVPPAEWAGQIDRIRVVGTVRHPRLGRHLEAFIGCYPFAGDVPDPEEFETLYTVMAWVGGHDLTDAVDGTPLTRSFGWVRDVAHAAGALHAHPTPTGVGIVHRDIKPSNVRVDDDGAVLIDFGVARPIDRSPMTRNVGAPGWMPPEALASPDRVGARSDTWQVGGLAAWVLLGTAPGALIAEDRRDRLEAALRTRIPPAAARPLARHIDQALAARPGDRPADLERWGDRLVQLAGRDRDRTRPLLLAGAGLVLVAAVLALAVGTRRFGPGSGAPPESAPIGTIEIMGGSIAPFDFGEAVSVAVTPTGGPSPGARISVEPMSGDRPAPGGRGESTALATGRQVLTFTVDGSAEGSPTVVDRVVVRTTAADGTPIAEQSEPVRLTFAPPLSTPEQCTSYDRSTVDIATAGPNRFRVVAGTTVLAVTASRTDADQVAELAGQADAMCLIGQPEGTRRPLHYWRRDGRLLGPLERERVLVNADCAAYAPEDLHLDEQSLMVGRDRTPLATLPDAESAAQALRLARHYHDQCVIGGYGGGINDPGPVVYWR